MIDFVAENYQNLLCYLVLAVALFSFWFTSNKKISLTIFLAALLGGLLTANINIISLLSIGVLGCSVFLFYNKNLSKLPKISLFIVIFVLTILLFLHKLPGFNNWQVFKEIQLNDTSEPFSFWLNFDKPLIAFFLLLFAYKPTIRLAQCKTIFVQVLPFFLVLTLILSLFGTLYHYIAFDPKLPEAIITSLWLVKMICFTVIVEELFFRFFIQNNIIKLFNNSKNGVYLGLVLSSLLFGIFHFSGGLAFVFLAFISGLVYGGVYIRTKHLESAILLHFMVNATHFFFFSYPNLIPAIS